MHACKIVMPTSEIGQGDKVMPRLWTRSGLMAVLAAGIVLSVCARDALPQNPKRTDTINVPAGAKVQCCHPARA